MEKYIDAEKLKAEIERHIKHYEKLERNDFQNGELYICQELLFLIDSLSDENNPELYNPVYDEDYLNEKIAKATKSWEGVDVDAMLVDCRGYEEKPSEDLEKAAANIYKTPFGTRAEDFIAGAEWQEKQDLRWAGEIHKNGYNLCKEQMLKDAVEGEIQMRYSGCLCAKTIRAINEDKFKLGDKVKIIILKDGE